MNNKKRILIVNTTQFGYHTDSYMYCKYIDRSQYEIGYFCLDMGFPKIDPENVLIKYIPLHSNKLLRFIIFINQLIKFLKSNGIDALFHVNNKFTLITRLVCIRYPMVLDIRTGDLSKNILLRKFKNFGITFTSLFYKRISVISQSLAEELKIARKKLYLLPLGGEMMTIKPKQFNEIRLLYIGTLIDRNIHETIYALSRFINKNPAEVISYDIVGGGDESSLEPIRKAIRETGLGSTIKLHGRKKQNELKEFFLKCNVGVVYVPCTKWYDFQPSTKLYECVLAGMPVIATDTMENRIALNIEAGVLCKSNPDSFSTAIQAIADQRNRWDSGRIKRIYAKSTWKYIVKHQFEPLFE